MGTELPVPAEIKRPDALYPWYPQMLAIPDAVPDPDNAGVGK